MNSSAALNTGDAYRRLQAWFEKKETREMLERTLPRGTGTDAWAQAALVAVRMDEDLLRCDPLSLAGSIITIASLGLRLEGPLGQAYLTAREIRKRDSAGEWYTESWEARAGVGYRGLIDLAWRDPDVSDIESHIVYRGDTFDFQLGSEQFLRHSWDIGSVDRAEMIAVYSGVRYRSGYYSFRPYPIADVKAVRRMALAVRGVSVEQMQDGTEHFFRVKKGGRIDTLSPSEQAKLPWIQHEKAMVQKTAINWSAKYWRLNPDFHRAAALAGLEDADVSQGMADVARGMPDNVLAALLERAGVTVPVAAVPPSGGAARTAARGIALRDQMVAEALRNTPGAPPAMSPEAPPAVAAPAAPAEPTASPKEPLAEPLAEPDPHPADPPLLPQDDPADPPPPPPPTAEYGMGTRTRRGRS